VKKAWWAAGLSALTAIVAALVSYGARTSATGKYRAIAAFAVANREDLILALLMLTVLGTVVDTARALTAQGVEDTRTLQRLLDNFSSREFPDNQKQNRLSLMKAVSGWKALWCVAKRLPLGAGRYKWIAAMRIRPNRNYLLIHTRSSVARSRNSATVLRIADQPHDCEGIAGKVWEEGAYYVGGLPKITAKQVRHMRDLKQLLASDPVRRYAEATNISNTRFLQSMDNFAVHFMGSVIRRDDGTNWGVLLLDSEDDACPFSLQADQPSAKRKRGTFKGAGKFGVRFSELAVTLGKVVR
jgi:hypothetical protein